MKLARELRFQPKMPMDSSKLNETAHLRATPSSRCLISRHFRGRTLGAGRGQVTVELSLILLPFFAILFAAIDLGQIYFYENAIQNGMREAARFATASV